MEAHGACAPKGRHPHSMTNKTTPQKGWYWLKKIESNGTKSIFRERVRSREGVTKRKAEARKAVGDCCSKQMKSGEKQQALKSRNERQCSARLAMKPKCLMQGDGAAEEPNDVEKRMTATSGQNGSHCHIARKRRILHAKFVVSAENMQVGMPRAMQGLYATV